MHALRQALASQQACCSVTTNHLQHLQACSVTWAQHSRSKQGCLDNNSAEGSTILVALAGPANAFPMSAGVAGLPQPAGRQTNCPKGGDSTEADQFSIHSVGARAAMAHTHS